MLECTQEKGCMIPHDLKASLIEVFRKSHKDNKEFANVKFKTKCEKYQPGNFGFGAGI